MSAKTILGLGQSNYRGILGAMAILANGPFVRAFNLDGVWTTNAGTQNDGSPYISPLYSLYDEDGPHQCLGLYIADSLVPTLVPTYDLVQTIAASKGGSSADDWAVSSNPTTLYGAMQGVVNTAGVPPDAVVIYQGEADTGSVALGSQWLAKWEAIVDNLQTIYGPIPIVVIELPANNPNAGAFPGWNTVRVQQAAFADVTKLRYVVQAPNTTPGQIHHTAAGLAAIGALVAPVLSPLLLGQATISTIEYSLMTNSTTITELTSPGVLQAVINASNMEAGDIFAVYSREKVTSGGPQERIQIGTLAGKQTAPFFSPTVSVINGWDFTMQKIAGLDRAFSWDIRELWIGNT